MVTKRLPHLHSLPTHLWYLPTYITGSSLEIGGMASPIGGEVSGYNPYLLWTGLARQVQGGPLTATMAFILDVRVVIGYRWVKFCPPVMSRNMAWAAQLLENKLTTPVAHFFQ
jgi:hypothetical protein